MLHLIEKFLAKMALISAKVASGTASSWNAYQPKEPKSIKKIK